MEFWSQFWASVWGALSGAMVGGLVSAVIAWRVFVSEREAAERDRATQRKHEVEDRIERRADEDRNAQAQRRERMLTDARAEGRLLRRWVQLASQIEPSRNGLRAALPPERDPRIAAVDASSALEVSYVPGAMELLWITRFDLAKLYSNLPEGENRQHMRDSLVESRSFRTLRRIQAWGLDPERLAPIVGAEVELAAHQPDNYLTISPDWHLTPAATY